MISHRIFISSLKNSKDGTLNLSQEESHHLVKVLRTKINEKFEGLSGMGHLYKLELTQYCNKIASVKILEHRVSPPPKRIELAIGIPKEKAMSGLIRRSTEMGISKIIPLMTQFSSYKHHSKKEQGWRADAVQACKQSGNPWTPEIAQPQRFEKWLNAFCQNRNILFYGSLTSPRKPIFSYSETIKSASKITWLVGPEGDFSSSEYQLLKNNNTIPVVLGTHVLRVETAVIAGLAQITACMGQVPK